MVDIVFSLAALLFGAIIGSFLNALSFRFNTGKGMGGRSRCMHCGHELSPLDLIPVFSFLLFRGRCRYCGSRISWQYPLVEGGAALLSLLILLAHPEPMFFVLWFMVWMVLLFIVVYDLRHGIIPWWCSLSLIAFSFIYLFISNHLSLFDLLAGPIVAAPLLFLSLISSGRWMGWGDGILELSLGWLLGVSSGLTALMLAFWSGALVGVVLLLLPRISPKKTVVQFTMRSEVPFAPFLALGAFAAHFLHVDFFSSLTALF
jgi:prepilin signal peptidase PulO-like enzyme (type II secretory pathway)